VAKSFFAGAAASDYLILYSAFGKSDDDAMSQGGFEEWRALMSAPTATPTTPGGGGGSPTPTPTPTIPPGPGGGAPEPGTLVLMASGLAAGRWFKQRRDRRG
jgi:hypothetical protein